MFFFSFLGGQRLLYYLILTEDPSGDVWRDPLQHVQPCDSSQRFHQHYRAKISSEVIFLSS